MTTPTRRSKPTPISKIQTDKRNLVPITECPSPQTGIYEVTLQAGHTLTEHKRLIGHELQPHILRFQRFQCSRMTGGKKIMCITQASKQDYTHCAISSSKHFLTCRLSLFACIDSLWLVRTFSPCSSSS